ETADGEVGRLPAGGESVDALLGLPDRAGVLGMHVDAVSTPVQLRGPDPDPFAQLGVEVDPVEFLDGRPVEVRHGPGETVGVGVEVQADRYLRVAVDRCHRYDATEPSGPG